MTDTYSAIQAAMLNDVNRMAMIGQNLANASTSGYKKQVAVNKSFSEYLEYNSVNNDLDSEVKHARYGIPHLEANTDPSMGSVKYTGNALDLVADGNTYFVLHTQNGAAYTKQGSFNKNSEGNLVNSLGHALLGESGEINITGSNPRVDDSGNVYDNDKLIAKLKTVSFKSNTELTGIGFGMYTASDTVELDQDARVNIKQGYVETSNVVVMDEMVKLIETMRHFEASQKFMMGYDQMLDNAINIIGEV